MVTKSEYTVSRISHKMCAPFILDIHYAKRWPSVTYAFGLFKKSEWAIGGADLCGIVTYGTPASTTLRQGIAGDSFGGSVLELNRLCLSHNKPNEASMLVGKSLRMLPPNVIVVSFADTEQGHLGLVYQATNFLYTGLSAKRTDWKVRGKEHLHGQTIADEFRGQPNRAKLMREKYGDDFYLAPRPRKHRYIIIVGTKRFRKDVLASLRYPIKPYPKKESH